MSVLIFKHWQKLGVNTIINFLLRRPQSQSDQTKKASTIVEAFSLRWCHQESNRGHKDFQSFALPTELWHHAFGNLKISLSLSGAQM